MRWSKARNSQPLVDTIVASFGGQVLRSPADVKMLAELMPGATGGLIWDGGKLRKKVIGLQKAGRTELSL